MSYIFKQKLNLGELAMLDQSAKRIVLAEPEEYLAGLYSSYLDMHNFQVEHCPDLLLLQATLEKQVPHLLILNVDNLQTLGLLKSIKNYFSALPVITVGYSLEPLVLKQLMSMGVSSHLNRQLTRPEDLVVIVKTILN